MIIPCIDIANGRVVKLRRGREFVLDGGDPFERLEEFSVAGEVSVVDVDAARGEGSNAELIREMVRRTPCRIGGGIRDIPTAMDWLDAGAAHVVIGTAASPEFCSQLPRERVIAAVDAECGSVVVNGWKTRTDRDPLDVIGELAPSVSGFVLTQVEHEGELSGFDFELVVGAVAAAGEARVAASGGVTMTADIAALDRLGADAQVGMALYTERISLGEAVAAPLQRGIDGKLWPTAVCDPEGTVLGLVWSSRETVAASIARRQGVFWSRSRKEMWSDEEHAGQPGDLIRVELDCDRDALKFTVRTPEEGFCHTGARGCWPNTFGLASLERLIDKQARSEGTESGTLRLLRDSDMLERQLLAEAGKLATSDTGAAAVRETADLLYSALVAARRNGVSLSDVLRELDLRNLPVGGGPAARKRHSG